jgi:hypothetical protein
MKTFFLLVIVLLLFAGCGPHSVSIEETSLPSKGRFETVWVNPRIIYADTLFTMISADRLDSLFVRTSEHAPGDNMPTVAFQVAPLSCQVVATLTDVHNRTILDLFQQTLPKAQYKITFDPLQLQKLFPGPLTDLRVKISVCGVVTREVPTLSSAAQ